MEPFVEAALANLYRVHSGGTRYKHPYVNYKARIQIMREENTESDEALKFWVGVGGRGRPEKSPQKRVTFKLSLSAIDRIGAGEAGMCVVWRGGF